MRIGCPASIPTCATRPGCRKSAAESALPAALRPSPGKTLEDDFREIVPVADEVSENADEQGLLDETSDDVLIRPHAPEERGEGDVDRRQGGRQKPHLAAEQAKARIDVGGEGLQEAVDDAGSAHGFTRPSTWERSPARLAPAHSARTETYRAACQRHRTFCPAPKI